ncbi:MAG: nucleotidyltransferase domain-containing protein [Candidatus Caldatribacterium sp.]|nr:nucleotidyltransferase domain-containing protein [Candidatus Caldatribacterium sp.]
MTREDKDLLEKVKGVLLLHEEIVFAYLFGSFAEGSSYRDIDIAVYCDDKSPLVHAPLYDVELSRELENVLRIPVDVVVLNNAPDYIVYRASRGILVKDTNENLRFDFLLPRLKKYLDFQELLKKYTQEFKDACR